MSNPVLVEVLRGDAVESRHRGAIAVADTSGALVIEIGDVAAATYPRSAVKALQALVLMESGAADAYGFEDEALALACASHSGEPAHVAGVQRMLQCAGLDPGALCCGTHSPLYQPAATTLARTGAVASALHNNCSGKHAGFLCAACAMGKDRRDYWQPAHPVQQAVKAILEDFTGAALDESDRAIDGCSVPTWAIPLRNLAHAFAKFGTGAGLSLGRAQAVARLRAACASKPWYVAGTGRFCTEIMQLFGIRAFVKTGAEGVYCGALPEQGLGIAIKCDDDGGRAAQVIMAAVLARFLPLSADEGAALEPHLRPLLRNWNGFEVGAIQMARTL